MRLESKAIFSWDDVHEYVNRVVNEWRDINIKETLDAIVPIVRGGLVPGVMLSHALDLPLVPVKINRSVTDVYDRDFRNWLEACRKPLPHVIVVDDIWDTGETLQRFHNMYASQLVTEWTTTMVSKETPDLGDIDFSGFYIDRNDWAVFPWEKEND